MRSRYLAAGAATILAALGLVLATTGGGGKHRPAATASTGTTAGQPPASPVASGCYARGPLPDPNCTPGAVRTTSTSEVCTPGAAGKARNVPENEKIAVRHAYGAPEHPAAGTYEVDHLISLELGGSNDVTNLWPEPAAGPQGFHAKDKVENQLHADVCAGRVTLAAAQRQIATDWTRPAS